MNRENIALKQTTERFATQYHKAIAKAIKSNREPMKTPSTYMKQTQRTA